MTVFDKFGVTKEEQETVEREAARLAGLGYNVPDVTIKYIAHANGVAGDKMIYVHPNTDLEELRFAVAHEIGHHNEPAAEMNIWSDETPADWMKKSEDFANWFARNV